MALHLEPSYHLTTSNILDTETHNDAVSGTCKWINLRSIKPNPSYPLFPPPPKKKKKKKKKSKYAQTAHIQVQNQTKMC